VTFQELVTALERFWSGKGCLLLTPYNSEVGAGTMNPATFLRVLGPEPWKAAYIEPSKRPKDGRYGENPNRVQQFNQYQVILKPSPENVVPLYIESLEAIGIDSSKHDIRLVEDDWESPTLGAAGLARGYNLVRGAGVGSVTWTEEVLDRLAASALLSYLAVAHYGRGRGDWAPSEYPPHWQERVAEVLAMYGDALHAVWPDRGDGAASGSIPEKLHEILSRAAWEVLDRLYPDADFSGAITSDGVISDSDIARWGGLLQMSSYLTTLRCGRDFVDSMSGSPTFCSGESESCEKIMPWPVSRA